MRPILRPAICLATFLALSAVYPHAPVHADSEPPLPQALERVMSGFGLPADGVSILVQAAGEPEARIAHNIDTPLNPASVMKLFTTFAALETLGPAHVWETEVYTAGSIHEGVLEGDLWIRGVGDPFLAAQEFWEMAGAIRRRGVNRITGDLVLDTSRFARYARNPGDFDNEPYRAYNQLPHPLLINFNVVRFELEPDVDAGAIRVASYPPITGLPLRNRIEFTHVGCPRRSLQYDVRHNPIAPEVVLAGRYGTECGRGHLVRRAMPVERYVYGLFDTVWKQWGGDFDGDLRIGQLPDDPGEPLATHRSRPLAEMVRLTNKYSNNVMTNQIALSMAAERGHLPATEQDAHQAILDVLREQNLELDGFVLDEVAGLSRHNRVTARQVAALLETARGSANMPEFMTSLPIAGVDGTMRNRFRGSREQGRMRLKTGRIDHVSNLAGYVQSETGESLIVVILINAPDAHRFGARPMQEAVLRWAFSDRKPETALLGTTPRR